MLTTHYHKSLINYYIRKKKVATIKFQEGIYKVKTICLITAASCLSLSNLLELNVLPKLHDKRSSSLKGILFSYRQEVPKILTCTGIGNNKQNGIRKELAHNKAHHNGPTLIKQRYKQLNTMNHFI